MEEQWRDVQGYEGLYQVSDLGRVRNKRWRILSTHMNGNGYLQTTLSKHGRREYPLLHRLVATAFIPNPGAKPQINHKNGIKTDNRPDNLEWCTMGENLAHRHRVLGQIGGRAKPVVCVDTEQSYASAVEAAKALGVSAAGVTRCCRGEQKTTKVLNQNKTLKFKFKEEQNHVN